MGSSTVEMVDPGQVLIVSGRASLAGQLRSAFGAELAFVCVAPEGEPDWGEAVAAIVDRDGLDAAAAGRLIAQLRTADAEERRSVIALLPVGDDGLDAIDAGADDVIFEPLQIPELRLRLALASRRAARISGVLAVKGYEHATIAQLADRLPMALLQFQIDRLGRARYRIPDRFLQRLAVELPDVSRMSPLELSRLISPLDRQRVAHDLIDAIRRRQPWSDAFELEGKEGERAMVRAFAFPEGTDPAGVATWNTLVLDVSSQRELEHRIERATSAVRSRDDFLATVSHELRTPLTVILGTTQLLTAGVHGELSESQREGVDEIDNAGRHLLALIGDMLDFSQLSAGAVELDIELIDIAAVCRAAARMSEDKAREAGLTIRTVFDERVKAAPIDRQRLTQALMQLLDNAIKFTPRGGEVTVEVMGDAGDDQLQLIVEDTGIGIPHDQAERMFEPFVQLDMSTDRRYGGAGLGLALVARLIQLHGGSIRADTTKTNGARLVAILPWPDSEETRVTVRPSQRVKTGRLGVRRHHVLLCGDNSQLLRALAETISELRHEVWIAHDEAEARERMAEHRVALLLFDLELSKEPIETLGRLVASGVPTVALTAAGSAAQRQQCLAAGAADYLTTPIGKSVLRRTIERLC